MRSIHFQFLQSAIVSISACRFSPEITITFHNVFPPLVFFGRGCDCIFSLSSDILSGRGLPPFKDPVDSSDWKSTGEATVAVAVADAANGIDREGGMSSTLTNLLVLDVLDVWVSVCDFD